MRTRVWPFLLCLLSLSCSTAPAPADTSAPRSFTLGLIPGAQEFVDFVMDKHGMLDAVGLKPERVKSLSPATLHLMVAERKVDIGFAGFTTMATARAEGKDLIVIHGVFSPVNMVFVRKDSTIRGLADLKGKKLGVFGNTSSTTFGFLALLARKWHGIDLFNEKEVSIVPQPAPLLVELLGRGDVDAALLGTTESIKMFAEDRFRVLLDLSAEYRARTNGRAPAHVTIATNEQFAKEHPDIVRDYLKAYEAAAAYIREHREVWAEYLKTIEVTDPKEVALFEAKMGPNIVSVWDQEQIAVQKEYLQLVHDIIGDTVVKTVPEGLIRDDFNP
jgi:ABC-type nitrate/sulfonate/bicarbonate transport system substrate-binding protein